MKTIASFVVALSLFACGAQRADDMQEHNVHVSCVGAVEGFNCTAVHNQGEGAVNACWTVNVTCANGTTTSGSTCADFQPGETIQKLIPMSEFPNAAQCDRATTTEFVIGEMHRI